MTSSEWTIETLKEHSAVIREYEARLAEERDRRYAEVSVEREKALKIKEVADLAALQLAREIQTYKDEKANELRSQIERERGNYATQSDLKGVAEKLEAVIKPLNDFVLSQRGSGRTSAAGWSYLIAASGLIVAIIVAVVSFAR
jgi:hypothetical protein